MSCKKVLNDISNIIRGPLSVLEDWAREPLKKFENDRKQKNLDRNLGRSTKEKTEVGRIESEIRKAEETHKADLYVRMNTEINRINAETEEWQKDQQFERMKKVTEAVAHYQERLNELNLNTIRAIGEMDIELRTKAQNLVLEKTGQYRQIQDEAIKQAEEEFDRIEKKYGSNERVYNIMISTTEKKLVGIIDSCDEFMAQLNTDIAAMNNNINALIGKGQDFIQAQLSQFNQIGDSNHAFPNQIEDAQIVESCKPSNLLK